MLSLLVCGLLDKFGLSCKFRISNLFLKHTHTRGWMDSASFLFNFFFYLHTFEPRLNLVWAANLDKVFYFPFLAGNIAYWPWTSVCFSLISCLINSDILTSSFLAVVNTCFRSRSLKRTWTYEIFVLSFESDFNTVTPFDCHYNITISNQIINTFVG